MVNELVALLSADINLCLQLTGLYQDVHAGRQSLCCSNAGFHSAGAGEICPAQGITVFLAEVKVGLKGKPQKNKYKHIQLLISLQSTQKSAGLN